MEIQTLTDLLRFIYESLRSSAFFFSFQDAAALVAEIVLLRHQLLVLTRSKKKCPTLITFGRALIALFAFKMAPKRIGKTSIAIASAILLDFHRALVNRKYSKIFSEKSHAKPSPKGPSKEQEEIEAKFKLSQNRSPVDGQGVIEGLAIEQSDDLSKMIGEMMRNHEG